MNRGMGDNSNAEDRAKRPLEALRSVESTLKRLKNYPTEQQPVVAQSFGLKNQMKQLQSAMARSTQSNVRLATTPGLVKRVRRQLAAKGVAKSSNYTRKLKRRNELSRLLSRKNRNERSKRRNRRELQSIEGDLLIMTAPKGVIEDPRLAKNIARRAALFTELRKSNVSAADKRRHLVEINAIEKGMLALL